MRRAQPDDLAAIGAIQRASPEASQWDPSEYLSYELRIASWDTQLAGFLVGRTLAPGESEILNFAVVPEWRRRGVGRTLIEAWIREFPGDVYLDVRASNETAQKFYKALGFELVVERPEYYTSPPETGIVMKFHSC